MKISVQEILLILGAIILLFGGRIFVSWARALGETKKEIKKLQKETEDLDV